MPSQFIAHGRVCEIDAHDIPPLPRAWRADKAQEGGINHAETAAPASTPSAKTNAPIISLAVWLSSGGVSSLAAGGRSTMVRHDSAATAWRGGADQGGSAADRGQYRAAAAVAGEGRSRLSPDSPPDHSMIIFLPWLKLSRCNVSSRGRSSGGARENSRRWPECRRTRWRTSSAGSR